MQENAKTNSMQQGSRWDIYLNGVHGVKDLTVCMLLAWRAFCPACGRFALALVELIGAAVTVVAVLVTPLLFWMAPVLAIFTAHRTLTHEEIRARILRNIHKNGGAA